MGRTLRGRRLVIASHNPGKLREIADLLSAHGIETVSAGSLGLPEPEETGKSFAANAVIKAQAAAIAAGMPALSDDSGLVAAALDGKPGINSARWAGPDRDFGKAMARVEHALADKVDRSACFICALCLAWPDGHHDVFEGRVDGDLVWPPRGDRGFGYDPIFRPRGYEITFGEMEPRSKHAMSHRARAFEAFLAEAMDLG
jgi:non-canonical purine NTP pyrophosphatase (RdgB/HAM1 family)